MGDDTLLRLVEKHLDTASPGGVIDARALAQLIQSEVGEHASLAALETMIINIAQQRGIGVLFGEARPV